MFPYNESEWEFISVIKDNRYKIEMIVADEVKNKPVDPSTKSVEKIKESLAA